MLRFEIEPLVRVIAIYSGYVDAMPAAISLYREDTPQGREVSSGWYLFYATSYATAAAASFIALYALSCSTPKLFIRHCTGPKSAYQKSLDRIALCFIDDAYLIFYLYIAIFVYYYFHFRLLLFRRIEGIASISFAFLHIISFRWKYCPRSRYPRVDCRFFEVALFSPLGFFLSHDYIVYDASLFCP